MARVVDKDLGWNRIKRELKKADKAHVVIGVLGTAGIHKGGKLKRNKSKQVNYLTIAMVHEFGNPRNKFYGHSAPIPERSFIRSTFDKENKRISATVARFLNDIYDGTKTTAQALKTLGLKHQDAIQSTMETGSFAPNKPVTIARKGSSKPLIATSLLKSKITFEVKGV